MLEKAFNLIDEINSVINGFVWGVPTIALILCVGIFMTIRLKGIQFREWGFMIKKTYVEVFTKKPNQEKTGEGEITSFQAAMASVSAVVGSGNIAGVAAAIVIGGPGALFWVLVAATIGMAIKYAEIALGVKYRRKMSDGSYAGGPMYYIADGLHLKWLGVLVAILTAFFSFVISSVVDTNTMALALQASFGIKPMVSGVVFAVISAIIIFGGITRIGEVCGLLSPFMAGAYLLAGIACILLNIRELPGAIAMILQGAFDPAAVTGGAVGSMLTCMRYGMSRGLLSNEAGIGTAAITHASATVNKPAEQAIWGPLEVFVDTFVVCSITGLTIILSGLWNCGEDGVALTMAAFSKCLPGAWGGYVVVGASVLFGFSCIITYYNYVEKSCMFLFGPKCKTVIKIIYIPLILVGAYSTLGFVWDMADTCNGLVIIPNLIALVFLSKEVAKMKDEYYAEELPKYKAEKAAKKAAKKAAREAANR